MDLEILAPVNEFLEIRNDLYQFIKNLNVRDYEKNSFPRRLSVLIKTPDNIQNYSYDEIYQHMRDLYDIAYYNYGTHKKLSNLIQKFLEELEVKYKVKGIIWEYTYFLPLNLANDEVKNFVNNAEIEPGIFKLYQNTTTEDNERIVNLLTEDFFTDKT